MLTPGGGAYLLVPNAKGAGGEVLRNCVPEALDARKVCSWRERKPETARSAGTWRPASSR
jgi:hypothetical protein